MKSIRVSFTVAAFIFVATVGLLAARTAEAGAAPNNQGIPGQIANLQSTVNNLQNTLNSLTHALNEIKGQVAGLATDFSDGFDICTTPDLVPLPVGAPGFSRCDLEQGLLRVLVKNQGRANAVASQTQVFFRVAGGGTCGSDCAQVDVETDALAARSGIDLMFRIPNGCFDVSNICKFKISVDGRNDVNNEWDESNNNAAGECAGQLF